MSGDYGIDLRLRFDPGYQADLDLHDSVRGGRDLRTAAGFDNLAQALTLALIVDRGGLEALGHPHYGSRVRDLIGEPMNSANLRLLERRVRRALRADARVAEVASVAAEARLAESEAVDVTAAVVTADGETVRVSATLELA